MSSVVLALSGGLDSSTLLAYAKHRGYEILGVSMRYNSKHNLYERGAAMNVAAHYQIPFRVVDLSAALDGMKSDLLKSGGEIPEGHYEAKSMERTVVPGRNIIFASVLAGIAWSEGADQIYLGVHAGDHAIYPDCRPEFVRAMRDAVGFGTDSRVHLMTPFLYMTKADIVKEGLRLNVPFHLTRTCYKEQVKACGVCGSCQERLEAFAKNGTKDPLPYDSRTLLPKEVIM